MNDAILTKVALALSILSLVLAGVAYWRSGGTQDVQALKRQFEELRVAQREFATSVSQSVAAAYERSRQSLARGREQLARLKDQAVEGLEKQVNLGQEQLEALAHRLEEGAKSAKDATVQTARSVEEAIGLRVRRVEARVTLLRSKAKATFAVRAADKKEFERAEELLAEATEFLRSARATLGEDRAYEAQLDAVKDALRDATTAVRGKAENTRQKIEEVLSVTDKVVSTLEADETKAAGQSP